MITIAGRPRRTWVTKASVCGEGTVIRIEDARDPEFWLDVQLDREDVKQMLADIDLERAMNPEQATKIAQ